MLVILAMASITCLMYVMLLGASKGKDQISEDAEQMEAIKEMSIRSGNITDPKKK